MVSVIQITIDLKSDFESDMFTHRGAFRPCVRACISVCVRTDSPTGGKCLYLRCCCRYREASRRHCPNQVICPKNFLLPIPYSILQLFSQHVQDLFSFLKRVQLQINTFRIIKMLIGIQYVTEFRFMSIYE